MHEQHKTIYNDQKQGADNVIMDRAASYMGSDKAMVESHLGVFSNDGLRTLLLAKKEMTKARNDRAK